MTITAWDPLINKERKINNVFFPRPWEPKGEGVGPSPFKTRLAFHKQGHRRSGNAVPPPHCLPQWNTVTKLPTFATGLRLITWSLNFLSLCHPCLVRAFVHVIPTEPEVTTTNVLYWRSYFRSSMSLLYQSSFLSGYDTFCRHTHMQLQNQNFYTRMCGTDFS